VADVFFDGDADLSVIQSRNVAVLGYGDEGRAHALCLRDSGVDVRMGLPAKSQSWHAAEDDGLRVVPPYEACEEADLIMALVSEVALRQVYAEAIEANLLDGEALFISHGFPIRFGLVSPAVAVDLAVIAPVGSPATMRAQFSAGRGVPALVAVEQDVSGKAWSLALSYAAALGSTRAGVIGTTIAEQTSAELFASQAILGGASELISAAYDTLIEAGVQPEVAYLAATGELRRFAELAHQSGVAAALGTSPPVTAYGAHTAGARVITDVTRSALRALLAEIDDGTFANRWVQEYDAGEPNLRAAEQAAEARPIEEPVSQVQRLLPPD